MSSFSGLPNLRNLFPLNQSNYGTVPLSNSSKVIGFTDTALPRDYEGSEQSQQHHWSSGYSRILTQKKSYNWTVENILSFRPEITTSEHPAPESFVDIKSPSFSVPGKRTSKWHMYMRFGGQAGTSRAASHASIWLVLEKPSEAVKANFEIKVLNEQGQVVKVHRSGFRYFDATDSKSNPWGFDDFIHYLEFHNLESSIFERNKLRIQLDLRLFLGTVNLPFPQKRIQDAIQRFHVGAGDLEQACSNLSLTTNPQLSSPTNDMRTAISTLWKNDKFVDVKIITGDKVFPAHKAILSARSPVFATMLGSASYLENKNNEVRLDTFSAEVVEAMLEFIYTDRTELLGNIEKASELLEAAEMYELTSLKYDCFVELINRMNIENASNIAVIAYYYKPPIGIMALIRDFFESNLMAIKATPDFKKMITKHVAAFSSVFKD